MSVPKYLLTARTIGSPLLSARCSMMALARAGLRGMSSSSMSALRVDGWILAHQTKFDKRGLVIYDAATVTTGGGNGRITPRTAIHRQACRAAPRRPVGESLVRNVYGKPHAGRGI